MEKQLVELSKEIKELGEIANVHKSFIIGLEISYPNLKKDSTETVIEKLLEMFSFGKDFDLLHSPFLLFPDEKFLSKLKSIGCDKSLSCFINSADLKVQLIELINNQNIEIDCVQVLYSVLYDLIMRFKYWILYDFDLLEQYENKSEASIVHRNLGLTIDRLNTNDKKNKHVLPKDELDRMFLKLFSDFEHSVTDKIKFRKIIKNIADGKATVWIRNISIKKKDSISKNEFYKTLFNLYYVIVKDKKQPLLSYSEYKIKEGLDGTPLKTINSHKKENQENMIQKIERETKLAYRKYQIHKSMKIYTGK